MYVQLYLACGRLSYLSACPLNTSYTLLYYMYMTFIYAHTVGILPCNDGHLPQEKCA